MKIKITLLLLVACSVLTINAQIIITQNFNNPSGLSAAGWVRTNNSSPAGTTAWFTGNTGVFPAFSSPDSTYLAANYNNTTGSNGTISNWLITPTVTVNNGGILQFATRTNTAAPQFVAPDRLEVYMSMGTGANVGTTATSLGTFTTLVTSVNPGLTATGYPTTWTVYTTTLTGITGTNTARFGFRYFVTSAGPAGVNSSYIGIDNIRYELPCPNPTLTVSSSTTGICSGTTFSISASGANTYTWSSGQNTASVTLSPAATTVYTVTGSSTPNCNSSATIAVTVTNTPIIAVNDVTVCAGTAATLIATGAPSYSWSTGATTSSIVVTPTSSATYTIVGNNGDCSMSHVVSVSLGSSLSINASAQPALVCAGSVATITASGASSYSYSAGSFTSASHVSTATVSPLANTVYTIDGASGTCAGSQTVLVSVNATPTVVIVASTAGTICTNVAITFTASGASSYSWTGSVLPNPIFSAVSPSVAGSVSYSVVGTGTNGCTSTGVVTRSIDNCTGIENHTGSYNKLSVYPNPFTNEIKISGFNGKIEMYNALGQLILKENISISTPLNTSELTKGVYILKAYSEDQKLIGTTKVIKN